MDDLKPTTQDPAGAGNPLPAGSDVDAKRRVARRRFLARGAVGGSGFLIVTLYHQRGIAGSKKIFTSSAEMCMSLLGTPGKKTEQLPDPENPSRKITAHQCSNVPDYKIPWIMKK